jgi:hypothetical protein
MRSLSQWGRSHDELAVTKRMLWGCGLCHDAVAVTMRSLPQYGHCHSSPLITRSQYHERRSSVRFLLLLLSTWKDLVVVDVLENYVPIGSENGEGYLFQVSHRYSTWFYMIYFKKILLWIIDWTQNVVTRHIIDYIYYIMDNDNCRV